MINHKQDEQMARTKLHLPSKFTFTTEIPVRLTDLNYGNHLGNAQLLGIIHEARMQHLNSFGCTEIDIFGVGIVVSDSVVIYKNQGFYKDLLKIESAISDIHKYGCDFYYRITNKNKNIEIAKAKTGILFFDYKKQKLALTPTEFKNKFQMQS
jgi:acyl-CoA thioester hydrolase